MLTNTQSQMITALWMPIIPELMIFVVVIAVYYHGDKLCDALEPQHRRGT